MAMPQTPAAHVPVITPDAALQSMRAPQVRPHAVMALRFVSQPFAGFESQSSRPLLHEAMPQTPAVQVPVITFGSMLQLVLAPHVRPQVVMALRLVSQPFPGLESQ